MTKLSCVPSHVVYVDATRGFRVTPENNLGAIFCPGAADLVAAVTLRARSVRVNCRLEIVRLTMFLGVRSFFRALNTAVVVERRPTGPPTAIAAGRLTTPL